MCTLGDYYAANPFTSLLTNKHTCSGGSLKLWLFFKSWDILLKTYYFIVFCFIFSIMDTTYFSPIQNIIPIKINSQLGNRKITNIPLILAWGYGCWGFTFWSPMLTYPRTCMLQIESWSWWMRGLSLTRGFTTQQLVQQPAIAIDLLECHHLCLCYSCS